MSSRLLAVALHIAGKLDAPVAGIRARPRSERGRILMLVPKAAMNMH